MMKYLEKHILEELDGAEDYMTEAVAHKGTTCGEQFRMMSDMEAQHANTLLRMLNKKERPEEMTEAEYAAMLKRIMDKYTTVMTTVEKMKHVYWN